MLEEEVKVHKTMEDFFTWKCDNGKNVKGISKSTYNYGRLLQHEHVSMVRMLKEEVKVHKTMEDFFSWTCDNGKNVKVWDESLQIYRRFLNIEMSQW
jgi:hypothetical protein